LLRRRFEADMAEEIATHLELQAAANRAAGMDAEEARYAARRQFGGVDQIKETARAQRAGVWLEQLLRDLRHAGRMLRRNPGFSAAAVLSLALCLGANSAIFSMLYALVIRPLPFSQAGRLVEIYNTFPKVGIAKLSSNIGQYLDFRRAPAVARLALWRLDEYTLGDESGPARIFGASATYDLFELLRVQPLLGRFFASANQVPAADHVVVLTQSFWKSDFQADPGVVGRTLRLDGEAYEIIGIAPRAFEAFDARVRLVRPLSWPPVQQSGHTGFSPRLFGRLKLGTSVEEAAAQVAALEQRYYDHASPGIREFFDRTGKQVRVDPLQAQRAAPVRTALYLLQAGVLFVLLIGCANVAHLLLARLNARRPEFAVRAALGAGRATLARQLFAESVLLTLLGAGGGLLLARVTLPATNHFTARLLPDALPFGLDGHVLGTTAGLAALLALLLGCIPVWQLLTGSGVGLAARSDRQQTSDRHARRRSGALVVTQVAFALVLLTGAGLLIRSFAHALAVVPGFDPERVIAVQIAVPKEKEKSFPPRLEAALAELPGVTASLATSTPYLLVAPFDCSMPLGGIELQGYVLPARESMPSAYYCGVTPSYLRTMRIPLREGRWFGQADMERGRVVVVDESFAHRYFAGRSAVGQHLVVNAPPPSKIEDWAEIIGVVGNVRHNGVEDRSGQPFIYLPLTHTRLDGMMSVLIRTARPASEVIPFLRSTVASIDPELPVFAAAPMEDVISGSFRNRRGIMLLLAGFAGVALLLSAVGIYGMLAYDVSRRTRELGIRSALGATRRQIVGLVLREGLGRAGAGIVAGLLVAAALSRLMASLLFEVRPVDPTVYTAGALLLLAVAAVASWLPARRAARVNPAEALRME